ncbi:phosphotransferase [Nitrospira sp. KM1]|uniref:hypothetical protein n=1 Tax=Nitrospira sp. KM1 TaxID=1936990 RepID=UPI0013A7B0E7|nr:hypothetical protein [Nitrospira sp. KM1]BCA55721.1 phosphotransferase [Nitrospira sp. KM1]
MKSSSPNIADLIPHQGSMCLLDSVETWDDEHIVCLATSHRRLDNPLRDGSGLRALCAIEYGAQAIAAHAFLTQASPGGRSGIGLLAAARDVIATVSHLDNVDGPLTIRAQAVLRFDRGNIYDVAIQYRERPLLTGRLTVVLVNASVERKPVNQGGDER